MLLPTQGTLRIRPPGALHGVSGVDTSIPPKTGYRQAPTGLRQARSGRARRRVRFPPLPIEALWGGAGAVPRFESFDTVFWGKTWRQLGLPVPSLVLAPVPHFESI